ncbi:MAG: HEAT repeat domain-containing protein, partial [bacterium]|nr:HEAT repeat domain-containing protein [bacterium]
MSKVSGKTVLGALVVAVLLVILAVQFFGGSTLHDPSSGNASERINAIRKIAAEGSLDAGKSIAKVAVGDEDPRVRCIAMLSLRKHARPEIRSTIEAGTKDKIPAVRAAAALTLGKYADAAAVKRLGNLLETGQDETVRLAAARGLARCKSRESKGLLVSAMKKNDSQEVQKQSLKLLLEGTGVSLAPDP